MNVERIIERIEQAGWRLDVITRDMRGVWRCRLFNDEIGRQVIGRPGETGFDLPCWRHGVGPNMTAAVAAAAGGIINVQKEDETDIDLAALLR